MKKYIVPAFALITIGLVVYGFFVPASETAFQDQQPTEPTVEAVLPSLAERALKTMTIEEKVGQLIMIGHWNHTPVASTTAYLKDLHVGGVIIMSTPSNPAHIRDWTDNWQTVSTHPLLISIDQEGGEVSRLRGPEFIQTSQPGIDSSEQAYKIGKKRGEELAALGINMNFAPVLDYAAQPQSFLYNRSFRNKIQIGSLATALIAGHADATVTAVPKHFPGHPDSSDDSHLVLPTLAIKQSEFQTHIAAFRNTLPNSQAIMTAHIMVPTLDDTFPTTLSPTLLTDVLRNELKYDGIIITDDLAMRAIADTWSSDEAAVMSIQAGADIVLLAANPKDTTAVHKTLVAAATQGKITAKQLDQAVLRILSLKYPE